ncbi:MAG: CocE/NonD family hydrolase C-terminal non-catalytic domain-containing protein, partial [Terriglobales bacterium]
MSAGRLESRAAATQILVGPGTRHGLGDKSSEHCLGDLVGRPSLAAWIRMDARDADFYLWLEEVRRNGRVAMITRDLLRARYRHSLARSDLAAPGSGSTTSFLACTSLPGVSRGEAGSGWPLPHPYRRGSNATRTMAVRSISEALREAGRSRWRLRSEARTPADCVFTHRPRVRWSSCSF